jgi:hypothetical protein
MSYSTQTIISSKRQDAIEPLKPRFQFWFVDQPQFATYERRGRLAAMLKYYRNHPDQFKVSKAGLHCYIIRNRDSSAVACIGV